MKVTHLNQSAAGTQAARAHKPGGRLKLFLHWSARLLTWGPLALLAFISGMAFGWIGVSLLVQHKMSNMEDVEVAAVVIVLLALFTWLAGKTAGSLRKSGLFVGGIIGLVLIGFAIWIPLYPAKAEYLSRQIAWGPSEVTDYRLFPAREIANGRPNFQFGQGSSPVLNSTMEYVGENESLQVRLEEFLPSTHTTSFIVIKEDVIIYEGYFNGYQRDSIVTSFSMAKSFTSALVGIAVDEGYIRSVDDRMIDYLPEMKGRGLDGLTIRHLLNMSSGIRYESDDEISFLVDMFQFTDDGKSYSYPDLRSQALQLKPGEVPIGAEFNYNNYHPQLLGMILERTTGRSPSAYLEEKIWSRLGMEYPASWSLDSEETGFELMTAGINGRAIDFARFGRLFLNHGNWEGQQIISEAWVLESTSPDPTDSRPWHSYPEWQEVHDGYYKYLWWGMSRQDGGYDFSAHGHHGQRIYVAPEENIVVVRFGTEEGDVDWDTAIRFLIDQVIAE